MTDSAHAARAVLIVEDNELLKLFMVNLVEAAGFIAIEASNADEAVSALESRTEIAILVTNVVMRGDKDGVELAHIVNNRWPKVKIIVVSGQAGLSERVLPPTALFLAKPYHDDELIFEIQALISSRVEAGARRPYSPTTIH